MTTARKHGEVARRFMAAWAPDKTARQIADEIGAKPDYVRYTATRLGLALRKDPCRASYAQFGRCAGQIAPWPDDMRFTDITREEAGRWG